MVRGETAFAVVDAPDGVFLSALFPARLLPGESSRGVTSCGWM
jgi:hypothetical protein